MDRLPREILGKILGYLTPLDRLRISLVSRTWAEEVSSSHLLEDVRLTICGVEMQSVLPTLLKSQRQYVNFRIVGADLSEDTSSLWTVFGRKLRRLHLMECFLTFDDLYSILRHCPKLECLEISGYSEGTLGYSQLEPLQIDRLDGFRDSLLSVRRFRTDFPVTQKLLEQLLGLMPNATSVSINYDPPRGLRSMPWKPCILEADRMFTKLDIVAVEIFDENLLDLVELYSWSLACLKLSCDHLTSAAYTALTCCTKLRHLRLDEAIQLDDDHLQKIVLNAPDLEKLDVTGSDLLTDAGIAHTHGLRNLRRLSLLWCQLITSNAVKDFQRISTLQHLDLEGITVDIVGFRGIIHLKELKVLILNTEIGPDMLEMICENLEKLEKLQLGNCQRLTDIDGRKLSSLKSLKCLGMLRCIELTDIFLEEVLESWNLLCLSLDGIQMTDAGLTSLAAHQNRLRCLELINCRNVTDDGFASLLRHERCLEALLLRACASLTQESLEVLGNNCPRLEYLEIDECCMTYDAVETFKRRRPFVCVEYGR